MDWFFSRPTTAVGSAYRATPTPDKRAAWRALRYCVLDVETSGLNRQRDALLAIGCVEIVDGRVDLARRWYSTLQPPADAPRNPEAIKAHQLLSQDLADAPAPPMVLAELLRRLAGAVVVVHVATIDIGFLNQALWQHHRVRVRRPILDTAAFALSLHQRAQMLNGSFSGGGDAPALALRAQASAYNLPTYPQHHALNDAITTAQLFLAQVHRLAKGRPLLLRDLLRASGI